MEWPHFYPVNCPPPEAEPASGKIYRLVQRDPVQERDFKPLFEENPQRFRNESNTKICIGCGLSVHTDRQDSEQLKKESENLKTDKLLKASSIQRLV